MSRTQRDQEMERIALAALAASGEPAGARRLAEIYRSAGVDVAEATAGRLLRQLEEGGLTRSVGARGRVLTKAGEQRLRLLRLQEQQARQSSLVAAALDAGTMDELIDLLHARRAVEGEAARLAATRASEQELRQIAEAARTHAHCVVEGQDRVGRAHDFHLLVARASRNRMLTAVSELLLDPANAIFDAVLDQLSADAGALAETATDHQHIAEALARRSGAEAERLMREHLEKLIGIAADHRRRQLGGRPGRGPSIIIDDQ